MENALPRRDHIENSMEADLLWLIRQKEGKYRWIGTKRELVEMTHRVWLRNVVFDPTGRVMPFTHLLRRVCEVVGMEVPKKPTAMLDNIVHRKNHDLLCMEQRYLRIIESMEEEGVQERPIQRFLAA